MPGGLSRRSVLLSCVAFAAALGGGYVLSSTGSAEAPAAAPIGASAVSLDVSPAAEGQARLGDAERLPALERRPSQAAPPPPPPPPPPAPDPEPEPAPPPAEEPAPPPLTPAPPTPAPDPPPPPPTPDPVEFDDSG